jgi:hypothetical protein
MALVQIYWEIRWGTIDSEIEKRLNGQERVNIDFPDHRLQLGRAMGDRDTIFAQVWGARILATPGGLPITEDPLDDEGLVWPGIEQPVTNEVAAALGATDYVYVDDSVLASYEGRQEFSIYPESGAVSHGTQWSVSFCDRIGRNTIRLEPRKLYEGAPAAVVRHWHKFAVKQPTLAALRAALGKPELNIAQRAKTLTYAMVKLGEALSDLAKSLGLTMAPEEFVGLRRSALDYSDWWMSEVAEPISRHAPTAMNADTFLDRCMSLEKLLIEGLSEKTLRKLLLAMNVPAADIEDLRTLKLFDRIVCMVQTSNTTGLTLAKNGSKLWNRLQKEGTEPPKPIGHLFALHDVRILKAHKSGDRDEKLQEELKRFEIQPGQEGSGYGKILDRIYDLLAGELAEVTAKIESVSATTS